MSLNPIVTENSNPTYPWSLSWDVAVAALLLTSTTSLDLETLLERPDILYGAQAHRYEVWNGGAWVSASWTDSLMTTVPRTFLLIRTVQETSSEAMVGFLGLVGWLEAGGLIGDGNIVPEPHDAN